MVVLYRCCGHNYGAGVSQRGYVNVVKLMRTRQIFHHPHFWLVIFLSAAVGGLLMRTPVEARSAVFSQAETRPKEISYDHQRALSIVQYVAQLIPNLPQPAHRVLGWALVGEIVWAYDPMQARNYFRAAFAAIHRVAADKGPEPEPYPDAHRAARQKRHQLRLEVLRRVARLDRQLERELMAQLTSDEPETSAGERLNSAELIELASLLVEEDPQEAVNLAQTSLQQGVSPEFGSFLIDLRQTDPDSADRLFNAALATATDESETNVDALLSLLNYASPQGVAEADDVEPSVTRAQTARLLHALAAELQQSESSPSAAQDASASSGFSSTERLALIKQHLPLFEQYAPETVPMLESVAHRLSGQEPPVKVQPTGAQVAEDEPADRPGDLMVDPIVVADPRMRDRLLGQAAISAAHCGRVHQAEQLCRRIQDRRFRQDVSDWVNVEIALQAIARGDFAQARQRALNITQVKQRAAVYIAAAEELDRRGENDRALFWLDEAYNFTTPLIESQEKARTLFRLVNAAVHLESPRTFEIAQSVITTFNRIRHNVTPAGLTTTLELSSWEEDIIQTFDGLGRVDDDYAFSLAMQLEALEARILAELAVCRVMLAPNANQS